MTPSLPLDRSECETIVRRLWPYLDGVLADDERERVVDHLAECAECRSHYDYADAFLRAVGALRRPPDDDRLRSSVLAALEGEGFRQV